MASVQFFEGGLSHDELPELAQEKAPAGQIAAFKKCAKSGGPRRNGVRFLKCL
jgi:hypothetical protein